MNEYIEALKYYVSLNPPDYTRDANSILELLYCYYRERSSKDPEVIEAAFDDLYQKMHGMSLSEMDRVIDAVCALCREHEKVGFVEGVKVGIMLGAEVE